MWIIIFIVALILLYIRDVKFRQECKIPGPPGLPFFGNGIELSLGKPEDYFSSINRYCTQYGKRLRLFLGNRIVVIISDPKDVEVVLMDPQFNEKSYEYRYLRPWLGTGLLTGGGEKWKSHRKVITPTFHFKILENFVGVFDMQSNIFVEKLRVHADGEEFNIQSYITLCALDIMCETAMGVSVNAQQDSESKYVNAVKEACGLINERIRNPLKRFDSLYRMFPDSRTLDKAFQTLHGYTNSMIRQRRTFLEESNEDLNSYTQESDVYGSKRKVAFLDLLLLSKIDGQPLSNTDIREEVDTFLFEGHDTVSSAISFAVYCLGNNRHIQEKLYQEQMNIHPNNSNDPLTFGDLLKMKYMELVIKEALRLYPSVPLIGRMIKEEVMINDMKLKKDTTLLIQCYKMNRNPEIFPDPEKFIPERFTPEESNKRNPFSSVFFSAGPRNCIGQKFAILEMKATLGKLVRNYIVESNKEPLVLTADIVLKSVHGITVKLTSRK